jgi:hypothetical protein
VEVNYYTSEAEDLGAIAAGHFEDNLSERFVFAGALGDQSMNKRKFIEGLEGRKDKGRRSTGLRLRLEGQAIAASMMVTTRDGGEYLNIRLFEGEAGRGWRCVRWSNAVSAAPAAPRAGREVTGGPG